MKILAIDSSGLVASVAVTEDDNLIAEYTTNYKKTHSQTLLPMLDEIVKAHKDAIAGKTFVVTGSGNVAIYAVEKAQQLGGKVVAMCDSNGFIHDPEGIKLDIVKDIKKMEEEAKVAIRSIRRDSMDKLKALKKNGEITEDDLKDAEKKMQNQTDKFIKEIESISQVKEKEIMEI